MKEKNIQPNTIPTRPLDSFDRKILSELVQDARQTYSVIGNVVGLSAPAVHERVKRMRLSGVITDTSIAINGAAIGKSFLAFVHVDADGWGKSQRMMELNCFPRS